MKFLPFSLIFCFLFIPSRNIYSDIIHLKDGSSKEGIFLGSDDRYLELDTFEKKIKIPVSNIQSVEVGFSGTPVCVLFFDKSDDICDYQLHSINNERIILLSGTGFLEVSYFSPQDISQIIWTNTQKTGIIPFLRVGIYAEIQTTQSLLKGKIIGLKNKDIIIEEHNKVSTINESEIVKLIYKPNSFLFFNNLGKLTGKGTNLIPGYYQYKDGYKVKGTILMGLSFFSILGATSQFNQAKNLSKVSYNFYPVNNRIYIEQDSKSRNQSIRSQKNGNALIGLFLVIFLYHLWDLNIGTDTNSNNQEARLLDGNNRHHSIIPEWDLLNERQSEIFRFQFSF